MSVSSISRGALSLGAYLMVLLFVTGDVRAADAAPGAVASLDALKKTASEHAKAVAALPAEAAKSREKAAANRRDFGIAGSRNFTVMAPRGDHLAEVVLRQAELYRREAALEWLGGELPDGVEFTHISVRVTEGGDEAITLLCGPGRSLPGDHRMWIASSTEFATGCTLAHEVTHVVLNARFSKGMPAWANEGIASRRDDDRSHEIRRGLLAAMAQSKAWPDLRTMLGTRVIKPTDQRSYAISTSLVEFFLARGDQLSFITFVEDGIAKGWDAALATHYGINDVVQLQTQWQQWVGATYGATDR